MTESGSDKEGSQSAGAPSLSWDSGTAYDFFVSLNVLHNPDEFGLRASWAAGVRSRLPAAERRLLEDMLPLIWMPLEWIYSLPAPKDAATALWSYRQMTVEQRAKAMLINQHEKPDLAEVFLKIMENQSWTENDQEQVKTILKGEHKKGFIKQIPNMLDCVSRPQEFGERSLAAFQAYYQSFFAEEEKCIAPFLEAGLHKAQDLAEKLSLQDLLAELSQGIHFEEMFKVKEIILAPTFWSTPLVIFGKIDPERLVLLFGIRPPHASLIPGEVVPDALLQALKALADPTRLKIMRYLAGESMTLAELSRRLRLRAPTVVHHVREMRLAGLVHLTIEPGDKRVYAARLEAIQNTLATLNDFIQCLPDQCRDQ